MNSFLVCNKLHPSQLKLDRFSQHEAGFIYTDEKLFTVAFL